MTLPLRSPFARVARTGPVDGLRRSRCGPTTTRSRESRRATVFVGTYTDGASQGIYRFEFDGTTGAAGPARLAAESKNPSFLAIAPTGRFLYAVNEVDAFDGRPGGAVSGFAIDPKTGDLTPLNQESTGGAGPCYLVVDKAGKNVLAANYGGGSVAVLPIGAGRPAQGAFGVRPAHRFERRPVATEGAARALDQPRPGEPVRLRRRPRARQGPRLSVRPDQRDAHPERPALRVGRARLRPAPLRVPPVGRVRLRDQRAELHGHRLDLRRPSRRPLRPPDDFHPPPDLRRSVPNYPADIQVHPSGRFLYGSNRGHDSIVAYAIDPRSGKLTLVGHQSEGIKNPRNFAIDPTGRFLLVANQDLDTVVVFAIDPDTGALSATGHTVKVPKPVCFKFWAGGNTSRNQEEE